MRKTMCGYCAEMRPRRTLRWVGRRGEFWKPFWKCRNMEACMRRTDLKCVKTARRALAYVHMRQRYGLDFLRRRLSEEKRNVAGRP